MASDSDANVVLEPKVEILLEVTRVDGTVELYRADGTVDEVPSKLDQTKKAFNAGSL